MGTTGSHPASRQRNSPATGTRLCETYHPGWTVRVVKLGITAMEKRDGGEIEAFLWANGRLCRWRAPVL